jgi:hypothetical protein
MRPAPGAEPPPTPVSDSAGVLVMIVRAVMSGMRGEQQRDRAGDDQATISRTSATRPMWTGGVSGLEQQPDAPDDHAAAQRRHEGASRHRERP